MGDININLGDTLPYLEQRFLQLVGKDQASAETASWFSSLQKTAMLAACQVKCIGMHRPLPLTEIYQPTRLKVKGLSDYREKRESFPHQDKVSRSIAQGAAIEERIISVDDFLGQAVMKKALSTPGGVESFVEILSNAPTFDHKQIAEALIEYYSQHGRAHYYENDQGPLKVTANLDQDFVRLASSKFLDYLVERCSAGRGKTTDTIAGYCMMELLKRRSKLSFLTYDKALALYKSGDFTFNLLGSGHVRLESLNPAGTTGRPAVKP